MGGIFGGISDLLFGKPKNPAHEANIGQYLDAVPGYGREAFNPFIEQGKKAYGNLEPMYLEMLQNPAFLYNRDVASYQPSGEFQYKLPFLQRAAKNAALSGGNLGTPDDEQRRAEMINHLLSTDMGSYLDRLQNYRGEGIKGFESAVGRGFTGAGSLADYLGNAAGNRANLEFAGQAQQEMSKNALMNGLMQAIATGFGAYMGAPGKGGGTPGIDNAQGYKESYGRAQRTAQTKLGLPGGFGGPNVGRRFGGGIL